MNGRLQLITAMLVAASAWTGPAAAQSGATPDSLQALRRQVEQRFDPLPLRDGVALRPKAAMRGVRAIEVTGGAIAIDGVPVTGAELRERIGADADVVIQLSYLDASARAALFGDASSVGTPPALPAPPAASDVPPLPGRRDRAERRDSSGRRGDYVRFGDSIRVGPDDVIDGDVVAIGGSAHIDGEVRGDVVSVGGSVELGPRAIVLKDVAVIGGSLRRAPGARVDGEVKEVGFGAFAGDWGEPRSWMRGWWSRGVGSSFALVSTITRAAVVCLLAAMVVLLAGAYLDRVSVRAAAEPVKAGAIGFLVQLLFLPLLIVTIGLLVITIVGIPLLLLLPFIFVGLGVVALVGFTAVARKLGEHIAGRIGWSQANPYLTTLTGVFAIFLPLLVARLAGLAGGFGGGPVLHALGLIGLFVEYLAWTVGFGAVALVRFGKKSSSQLTAAS